MKRGKRREAFHKYLATSLTFLDGSCCHSMEDEKRTGLPQKRSEEDRHGGWITNDKVQDATLFGRCDSDCYRSVDVNAGLRRSGYG